MCNKLVEPAFKDGLPEFCKDRVPRPIVLFLALLGSLLPASAKPFAVLIEQMYTSSTATQARLVSTPPLHEAIGVHDADPYHTCWCAVSLLDHGVRNGADVSVGGA